MSLQYGQWGLGETPITFRLNLAASTTLTSGVDYQIRIPMIMAPSSTANGAPVNVNVYMQRTTSSSTAFAQNLTRYEFRNYAVYTNTPAPTTTPTFTTVQPTGGALSNRAQSSTISFDFALSSLVAAGGFDIPNTDWFLFKWDSATTGIDASNLPLFTESTSNWNIDYYAPLTLYLVQRKTSLVSAATPALITFAAASPAGYKPALFADAYGLKYAAIMRSKTTIRVQAANPGVMEPSLASAAPIRYAVFAINKQALFNAGSLVDCELMISTPQIPPGGSIQITL